MTPLSATITTEPKPWVMKIPERSICKLCGAVQKGSLWVFYEELIDGMQDHIFCQECTAKILIDALVIKTIVGENE